jgi:glutamate/tyrosine decarboxylase-like PLP-dependent enzyme
MAARLREHIRLANLFAGWIKEDNDFELAASVSLGVVCFRFVGRDGSPSRPSHAVRPEIASSHPNRPNESRIDQLNGEIVETINASGRAYLTQTKLRGRTVMRIGLGNVLTTEEHLQKAWKLIGETANRLAASLCKAKH